MSEQSPVICIGEVLWDALPAGLFLGGAPLNVCLNLNQLGVSTHMVSRVGNDRLGYEARKRMEANGLSTQYIQQDDEHETGFVEVELNEQGEAEYTFIQPAAWDFIALREKATKKIIKNAGTVIFGTLAYRMNDGLNTLLKLDCLKVLDMNLRAPHFNKQKVVQLTKGADIVKMNQAELELLRQWSGFEKGRESLLRQVASSYNCRSVCVSCGSEGAMMVHENQWFTHGGFSVSIEDTVGAGDAFLAALLLGLQNGAPANELLPFANAAGACVASKSGANPNYGRTDIEAIMNS